MIIDICQSTYDHASYTHFGDKTFLKKHNTTDIVCSECLQKWLEESTDIISREIIRKIMPIWDNRKELFMNKNYAPPEEPTEDPQEPEEEVTPSEGEEQESEETTPEGESETHVDYTIPEEEESEEDEDLQPLVPDPSKFTPEDLQESPEIYSTNVFKTNATVILPNYMKYILCLNADIEITGNPGEYFGVTVTFYGPCARPHNHEEAPCGCQNISDPWVPVGDLISPKKPLHQFRLEVYPIDLATENRLARRIFAFMSTCIGVTFDPIPKEIVQALMDEMIHKRFSGNRPHVLGASNECYKCGIKNPTELYYFYRRNFYCLECMYKIVVDLAVNANLAEKVGLATACDTYSVEYLYRDTRAWKRAVIDRYINAMKETGAMPEITCMYPF